MCAILTIQALVFQDGGILALGANIFNMALMGVLAGYLPFYLWGGGRRRRWGCALEIVSRPPIRNARSGLIRSGFAEEWRLDPARPPVTGECHAVCVVRGNAARASGFHAAHALEIAGLSGKCLVASGKCLDGSAACKTVDLPRVHPHPGAFGYCVQNGVFGAGVGRGARGCGGD